MPINILMPALSPTMTEGNLAKWHKKEGDTVEAGDVIAEIETDKATMEVEAVDEGTIGKIIIQGGTEGVKVNELIAVLLEEGETANDIKLDSSAPVGLEPQTPVKQDNQPAPAPKQQPSATKGSRIFISPLAKRIANQNNLDIASITGTGPNGRIVKDDVEKALSAPKPAAAANTASTDLSFDAAGLPSYQLQEHTMMRKVIAKRLTESKQTVPHFYLTVDVELDKLLGLRKEINTSLDMKISVNDFVIKASAKALRDVPAANASWFDDGVHLFDRADISVAVAIDGGLITPIVRGACGKSLKNISVEMKELAARARDNKLMPEEFTGGTFSLSNLGMFGIKHFGAIVNPPQGCILAVGAGEQQPVIKDGEIAVATKMSCTLSVDHRVVDGAVGAEFIQAFKQAIENPLSLVL